MLADLDRDDGAIDSAIMRAQVVAQRIQDSLAAPFRVDGTEVYVAASIGISLFPNDAADTGTLLRNAETAMYEAKRNGRSGFVLAPRSALDSSAKLAFVTRLRKAVELQRWVLHYQPVVDLDSGRMLGVEALTRWVEPDGTMVPPNDFIPLAEELGLIEQIGDWVVRELTYQVQGGASWTSTSRSGSTCPRGSSGSGPRDADPARVPRGWRGSVEGSILNASAANSLSFGPR